MDLTLVFAQDVIFMALTLWREARGEPHEGKIAVAHSIMNRVRRPSWWGNSVLAVVFKRMQYSSLTDPHDNQLTLWPDPRDPQWAECVLVSRNVYDGTTPNPVPGADSYYAAWMDKKTDPNTGKPMTPNWADPKKFVRQVGAHKFYDLDQDYERRVVPA